MDAFIHSDMSADAVDYEAESWSLTVEHKFCKKQDKRAVKRQDVIYGKQMSELGKKKKQKTTPPASPRAQLPQTAPVEKHERFMLFVTQS